MKNSKLYLILLSIIILILLVVGYTTMTEKEKIESSVDWREIELSDVSSGSKFQISDFKGKPILLESFAVWCPTCLSQQKEIGKLKSNEKDGTIHISLDTDPNEDEVIIKKHITENNFDWYFAIAPAELTKALIKEFGLGVVNAPSAPVVLICEDQSTRFLGKGVKSEGQLKSEIEKGC